MVVDATEKFLDRFAVTLAIVKGKEESYVTAARMSGLTTDQRKSVALKSALIKSGKKRGG